jgi:threonine dehydrogenase-like Zn-dependent dehydrogenase
VCVCLSVNCRGAPLKRTAIDVVGHQGDSIDICSDMTAADGTVLIFGLPPNSTDEDRHSHHSDMKIRYKNLAKNLSYITTHVGGNVDPMPMFKQAMEMLSTGRIDVSPIMTHVFSYRDFPQACELTARDCWQWLKRRVTDRTAPLSLLFVLWPAITSVCCPRSYVFKL